VNYKRIYSVFLTLFLVFSLLPVQFSSAATFALTAKAECGYIMLQWDKVPGALRYYVYRGPSQGQEYNMPLTDFAITDTFYKDKNGLMINQKYYYVVKAVDQNSQEFSTSNEVYDVYSCNTTIPIPPDLGTADCRMVLKYQVDSRYYWKNDVKKGPMDASPELRYSRVNLMARYLAEEIGASVGWNSTTQTVSIKTLDGTTIEMIIGQSIAKINGVPTALDPNNPSVVPYIYNGRTYTPLRFISYHLGANGPSDIIWRGDVNMAELTFKDPRCKWMNGAIRLIPNSSYQYGFYENCGTITPYNANIDMNMKDTVLLKTFTEYIKEYSNQNYWCAQVRVDESNNIVSWRGRPDLFPNCCKPATPGKARIIGYVNGSGSNPGTVITVYNPNGAEIWSGKTDANGYYETSTQSNCILPCPATYKIVAFRQGCSFYDSTQTVTFTDKQCCGDNEYLRVDFKSKCPGTETARIIGYVYGANSNPGTTIQIYDSIGAQVWRGQTNSAGYFETSTQTAGILTCPGTYRIVATKTGCTFYVTSQTVTFAVGESCEEGKYKRVNFTANCSPAKTGRIVGHVYGAGGNPGITVTVLDSTGAQAWSGETDVNGYYETSATGSNCILIAPGTYKVVPSKAGCSFTSAFETVVFNEGDSCEDGEYKRIDFRSNCSPVYKGKIMGFVFGFDANPGTIIQIYDSVGALVWRGLTDVNGFYETSAYGSICVLKCPATYKVVASKAGCTFSTENEIVTFLEGNCCEDGEYKRADFRSNCSPGETARIIGYVSGTGGNPGTIVTVYDSTNRQIWTGQTNRNGYYETSALGVDGILKCPGTYKIVPTKAGCTFTEPTKSVTFTTNESVEKGEYKRIDFASNCSPGETARITGHVYGTGSNPGTLITITDSTGVKVWSGMTNATGYYETSRSGTQCILKSPGTYKVVPTKAGCSFTKDSETVTFTVDDSCEDGVYVRVDFTSNCATLETGRIIGYIYGSDGNPGTTITILDNNGVQVWRGITTSSGYYETSASGSQCILKSPGIYKVIPTKAGCSFTNASETVEFVFGSSCEEGEYKRVDFRSNCSHVKTGRINGYVSGTGSNPNTTITITDAAGVQVWRGQTTSSGYYETSSNGTNCILKCPGTYKIVPSKTGCSFTASSETVTFTEADSCENGGSKRIDFTSNCEPAKKARITGNVFGSGVNPGVLITITDSTGVKVWSGTTNSTGYYETSSLWDDCILNCPGTYKVTPTKAGCTFTDPYETVRFADGNCCEDGHYMRVNFNSNCSTTQTARIAGYVYGTGGSSVTITVYNTTGTQVWSGQTNSSGFYETSSQSGGILPCPGTYKIVPTKAGCTFSNTYEMVTFYDGDSTEEGWYMRVDFRSYCPTTIMIGNPLESKNRFYDNIEKLVYLTNETNYVNNQYC
jgi:hypothetical protein